MCDFFYFWKSATYEKNVEKFYSHMTSVFTAFFTLHYFSWKLNSKNIYHKMKNSILIFNNFFLGINSSTKMRWKKFVKNEKLRKGLSIKVFGFCFFLLPNPNSNRKAVIISADGLLVKSSYLALLLDTFIFRKRFQN